MPFRHRRRAVGYLPRPKSPVATRNVLGKAAERTRASSGQSPANWASSSSPCVLLQVSYLHHHLELHLPVAASRSRAPGYNEFCSGTISQRYHLYCTFVTISEYRGPWKTTQVAEDVWERSREREKRGSEEELMPSSATHPLLHLCRTSSLTTPL